LTNSGDSASVRFFFAFFVVDECYGDISTAKGDYTN
jgi:hypothetical protein